MHGPRLEKEIRTYRTRTKAEKEIGIRWRSGWEHTREEVQVSVRDTNEYFGKENRDGEMNRNITPLLESSHR